MRGLQLHTTPQGRVEGMAEEQGYKTRGLPYSEAQGAHPLPLIMINCVHLNCKFTTSRACWHHSCCQGIT